MDILTLRTLLVADTSEHDAALDRSDRKIDEFARKKRPDTKLTVDDKQAASALQRQRRLGADWEREISANAKKAGVSYDRFGQTVHKTTREQKAALVEQQRAASHWSKEIERDMARAGNAADRFGQRQNAAKASAARGQLAHRVTNVAAVGGAGILAGLGASAREAVAWESAFAGVRKTVDGTEDQLSQLNDALREMATAIPVAADELANIAENAGQLGIETQSIESFTRVMADLGVATNMSSDQAASSLAKIANIVKNAAKRV